MGSSWSDTWRSRTGKRLGAAFLAVLLLFGAALVVELVALRRIAAAEAEVAELDHAKHSGHKAASMVREQYIREAHTLIEFDDSHLDQYEAVVKSTRDAVAHLRTMARSDQERALAGQIAQLAAENDRDFRALVLPAIRSGDRGQVTEIGARLEAVVDRVVQVNDELNHMFETRSEAAREHAGALRGRVKWVTLLCFGLAIALAAIVGAWLARSIVRPVAALQAGTRRVGEGDLDARIEIAGGDEFAELAAAFNQMTESLARNQEALVRSQKLASVGQVAAGVAHEINNPLGVILGYTRILRQQPGGGDSEELRIIEDETRQCQRIVQSLLELARPQRLAVEPVDLAELTREEVERLSESGRLDGRTVQVGGGDRVGVDCDAGRVRQVIANLVVNAVQASPPDGEVRVEVAGDGHDAIVTVSDRGRGIAPDELPRVFDPFFTTKPQGTGLGLAIAQAIADAHGGRIEIHSVEGEGTRVALRLPRAAAQEGRA